MVNKRYDREKEAEWRANTKPKTERRIESNFSYLLNRLAELLEKSF